MKAAPEPDRRQHPPELPIFVSAARRGHRAAAILTLCVALAGIALFVLLSTRTI